MAFTYSEGRLGRDASFVALEKVSEESASLSRAKRQTGLRGEQETETETEKQKRTNASEEEEMAPERGPNDVPWLPEEFTTPTDGLILLNETLFVDKSTKHLTVCSPQYIRF